MHPHVIAHAEERSEPHRLPSADVTVSYLPAFTVVCREETKQPRHDDASEVSGAAHDEETGWQIEHLGALEELNARCDRQVGEETDRDDLLDPRGQNAARVPPHALESRT